MFRDGSGKPLQDNASAKDSTLGESTRLSRAPRPRLECAPRQAALSEGRGGAVASVAAGVRATAAGTGDPFAAPADHALGRRPKRSAQSLNQTKDPGKYCHYGTLFNSSESCRERSRGAGL